MDFNVKRLTADAGIFLTRAVQFTGEILGQAEKTELDAHLETLLARAEYTKLWTERIMKQTEVLLQPNPNVRIEEFLYEKLEKKVPMRANNHEQLGTYMIDSGHEFGPGTAYGNALIKCGETERQIGGAEREFIQSSANNFLTPFRNFIEGDFQTISRERKFLQNRRLDLDVTKSKLKKARVAEARSAQLNSTPPLGEEYGAHFSYMLSFLHVKWLKMWSEEEAQAETELRVAQSEFDQQAEITRLLLEGVSDTHAHHLHCLNEFVEAQATYYARCYQHMVDLQKKLGSFASMLSSNNNQQSSPSRASVPIASSPSVSPSYPSALNELPCSNTSRQARVVNDYEAAGRGELCLAANEIIMVSTAPGMDSDWLMGERGNHKGKVPISYLELLN
ncbi:endophilin-B1b [Anguilla anguilla]|uniref:endophilin-B1b n=1 Tax=Anguilla anguilla TaxID=7936 RepID=UPI0015B0079D|nr:endophilin-B1b [Anguilla anguilla]